MWEPLQATLDPGRGLPLLVGPLWWKGYRPRVRPKREPKGTKRFFNEEIVQALCTLSADSDALNVYQQELLHHCTYHRIILFLRQLLITIKIADTGFIVCWLAHQPIHVRYLGPSRAANLYLLRLHDTLEILLFKPGGDPVRIQQPLQSSPWYRSMFGFQTKPQGVGTERLCAFAIQQERICTITEKPWTHSFVEPGCALWRLSHLLLAAENNVRKEPFANVCHLALGNFPVVLIGGYFRIGALASVLKAHGQPIHNSKKLSGKQINCPITVCCSSINWKPLEPAIVKG